MVEVEETTVEDINNIKRLMLIIMASCFYLFFGCIFGFLSACFKDTIIDRIIRGISSFNLSVPSFWLGLLMIWLLAVVIKVQGILGYSGYSNLILPSIVMGFSGSGGISRMLRSVIIEATQSRYAMMAKGLGMKKLSIFFVHVFKNILNTIITLTGMYIINLLGGSLIMENVFGLPGIGKTLVNAVNVKDFPVISGFLLLIGTLVVTISALSDILYAIVDPRVRFSSEKQ